MAKKVERESTSTPMRRRSSTEKIFGDGVMGHGYTGVPNILVRAQSRLGLNPVQFNILVQLLSYWINPGRPPFPPKRDLRKRMGISESTLKKHIKELEQAGFIKREQQTTSAGDFGSNIYHLDGLIQKLEKLVPDFDQEREERDESRRKTETPRGRSRTKSSNSPSVQ